MIKFTLKYFKHLLTSGHRVGRGIHSPWVYALVSEAIYDVPGMTIPGKIQQAHRKMLRRRDKLTIHEVGAGSRIAVGLKRRIGSMVRWSSVSPRNGRLLYRLARWFGPESIIELGTGLGISTSYLALGCPEARLTTVEGSNDKAILARSYLDDLGIGNTDIRTGLFEENLNQLPERDYQKLLVFIDGNHKYEPTVNYVRHFIEGGGGKKMIILDDIHWSDDMERAWGKIGEMKRVQVTLDLFYLGIAIVNKDLSKQNYRLIW